VAVSCPKCATPFEPGALECRGCGVVFAKLAQRAALAAPVTAATALYEQEPVDARAAVPERTHEQAVFAVGRGLVLAGLAVWTWQLARMGGAVMDSVLHLPDLVFHEAGHVLLGIFGRFIGVLGGSLFQFALPLILAGAFLRQRDQFGAAVCTWWAGQNLLDLAPYIADARALQLVLLGGRTGAEVEGHDWEYLLTELGWLHLDRALGQAAYWLGLAMMVGAILWGVFCVARHREQPEEWSPD
jgi:hypothetical protein